MVGGAIGGVKQPEFPCWRTCPHLILEAGQTGKPSQAVTCSWDPLPPSTTDKSISDRSPFVFWSRIAVALSNIDRELLHDCLSGSEEAWRGFCDRYVGLISRTVELVATSFRVPLDNASRDDLVAEVFLELLERDCAALRQFRGESSLAAYLVVITRRTVIKRLAHRQIPISDHTMEIESLPDLSHPVESIDILDWNSSEAFRGLSNEEASAIRMFHLEGKTYREIGTHLGLSENSIGPFLSRARQKLRRRA
jgi:RNA polymerase sigma-70 factor, ECF subfamily